MDWDEVTFLMILLNENTIQCSYSDRSFEWIFTANNSFFSCWPVCFVIVNETITQPTNKKWEIILSGMCTDTFCGTYTIIQIFTRMFDFAVSHSIPHQKLTCKNWYTSLIFYVWMFTFFGFIVLKKNSWSSCICVYVKEWVKKQRWKILFGPLYTLVLIELIVDANKAYE